MRPGRLAQSQHNTMVTVSRGDTRDTNRPDMDLVRLSEIPSFLPIMQGRGLILFLINFPPIYRVSKKGGIRKEARP